MARFEVNGFEMIENQLGRMNREMIRRIVDAGAKAAGDRMRANTESRRHVRTGDMLNSIGDNGYREFYNGGSTEVYPQGEDRAGTRNATKAYVINYGKGRKTTRRGTANRTGDKFITGDESKAEEAVTAAMQAESDRLLAEIGG